MPTRDRAVFVQRPWRLMLATLALTAGMAQAAFASSADGPLPGMHPGEYAVHPGLPAQMRGGAGTADGEARHLGRMLEWAGATPEQRHQIHQIMQAARRDLQAPRQAARMLREQQLSLLTQPTVDVAAVEVLRQQRLAQHDQASRRMTQALVAASRVLTPEQRKVIGEHRAMRERHRAQRQSLESAR